MRSTSSHNIIESVIESLEPRALLSVSVGSDGFTDVGKSTDTRIIYVSSSGSDGNNGLSSGAPVKTFGKAKSLMRDGKPDWMLIQRGDTFTGGIGQWKTSGRSSTEPQLIGTYGTGARPLIKSGTKEGFVTFGGTGTPVNNVALIGIEFVADTYNGKNGSFSTTGIRLTRQGTNWLIEDCKISGYKDNITLDADGSGVSNLKLRRNQIVNAYTASKSVGNGNAQGLYIADGQKNITIEQNLFDHNGWKSGVSGAGATMFNHNIYVNTGVTGTVIQGNIITRASLAGITVRSGATIKDNLITQCPVGIKPGGSGTTITGNVILDGTDLAGTSGGATGIDVTSLNGITISNNIIAREKSVAKYHVTGIRLNGGVKNATVTNNIIYDWQQAINNGADSATIKDNKLTALNSNSPLIAQVKGANTSAFKYANNIYDTPRTGVNSLANSDKTLAQWISATKETGARSLKIKYANPTRTVSITASLFNAAPLVQSMRDAFSMA